MIAFNLGDVVLALQIEPELRAVAEVAAEADGGIGGDGAPAIQDVGDAAGGNAKIQRQPACAEPADVQLALEQTAGMSNRR